MIRFIKKYNFYLLMFIGISIGAYLRLYRIGSQIIWDDEWHAVQIALLHPLKYIFTNFHWDYNSIPLTIYYRLMLESIWLNEIIIRLPQLLSGILMLLIFPVIVKKLFNRKVALIFLFMLAISPLSIYVSRDILAFGIVVFLSFISIFSFYIWMNNGKTIYLLIYLGTSILSPYFHISSAAFVSAPLLFIIILALLKKRQFLIIESHYFPEMKKIVIAAFILIAGISVWMIPLVSSLGPILKHSGQGFIDIGTLVGCASLFCGSISYSIFSILIALFFYGLCVLFVQDKLLFSYLCTICLSQLFFIVLTRPYLVQISMIFTRYFLPSLPVWVLIISIALNDLYIKLSLFLKGRTRMANSFSSLVLGCLILLLFLKGPIPIVYSFPNDFTNHKDFQYKYLGLTLKKVEDNEGIYPAFYSNLKDQDKNIKIVEFPAIISWTWNIFHVYQNLHHKKVIIGYNSNAYGPFYGYGMFKNKNVSFKNFIDISDPKMLPGSGVDFIVLHKNIWKECATFGLFSLENKIEMENRLSILPDSLRDGVEKYFFEANLDIERAFGMPFYEDEWIIVYKIK